MSDSRVNGGKYVGRPSMCRNCGALIGATESNCSLCGASKDAPDAAPARAPHVYDHETMRFARAILTRPYIFTIVFLVANIFLFILTTQAGAEKDAGVLLAYGAKSNFLINEHNEWWRFITPMFLHGGIAHVLMNMYGLWVIGPYVERLYGSAKFVFFWIVTGIAGVVASYLSVQPALASRGGIGRFLFKSQDAISVGASGALFGLIGVLFVFGIKFRHELPEGFKRAFGTGMLPTILLNIAIGFMIPVIDNAAHLGGLVAGALLALLVGYKRPGEKAGVAVFWHVLQVGLLALVVVSFVMVAKNFRNPEDAKASERAQAASVGDFRAYVDAINQGLIALNNNDAKLIDEAIQQLEKAPTPEDVAGELRDELRSLLLRWKELTLASTSKDPRKRPKPEIRRKLRSDIEAWDQKFDNWISNEGSKYGIVRNDEPAANGP